MVLFICIEWVAYFVNKYFEPEMKVTFLAKHAVIVKIPASLF